MDLNVINECVNIGLMKKTNIQLFNIISPISNSAVLTFSMTKLSFYIKIVFTYRTIRMTSFK